MTFSKSGSTITQENESSKNITAVAAHTNGIEVTVTAHAYGVGDYVIIKGTTNYNGAYEIISKTTNAFVVDALFDNTETGTVERGDKDLVGLGTVTGVTEIDIGDNTNSNANTAKIAYDVGTDKLIFEGVQKIDPDFEEIITSSSDTSNAAVTVDDADALLFIDGERTENGYTYYSTEEWLKVDKRGAGVDDDDAGLYVKEGTLDWRGGRIRTGCTTYFENDSDVKIRIKNAIIYSPYTMTNSEGPPIRAAANDFQIDGLVLIGGRWDPLYTSPLSTSYIKNYQPVHSTGGITPSTNSSSTLLYVFEDFDPRGNDIDLKLWRAKKMKILNSVPGTDVKIQGHQANSTNNKGLWEIAKEFALAIKDSGGSAIEGARYFIRDYDNGDRADFVAGSGADVIFSVDRTYTGLSDSSGDTSTVEVLTGAVARNTGGAQVDPDTGLNKIDYRSKNDDSDDVFDINLWSYNHLSATITTELKGAGVKNIDWTLFDDDRITEDSATTVAAYTGIAINHTTDSEKITITESHNLDEIFDYVKYNKTLSANAEKPTVTTLAATPDGKVLDLGEYDLEVSGTDTELTAGTKYNSMTTTGTISTASGGVISVGYTDSSGSTVRIVSSVANTKIYCELVTAGDTEIVDTGSGTEKYLLIPINDTAKITAKAEGYKFRKGTIDPTTDTELLLSLEPEPQVDLNTSISDYTHEPDYEFNFATANANAAGIVKQFGKIWVLDNADYIIYAYNLDGTRDSDSDITLNTGNRGGADMTYTSDRLLVLDSTDSKFYAYDPDDGSYDSSDDFDLDDENTAPTACSNAAGNIMVSDTTDNKAYAYQTNGTRLSTSDYNFHDDNDSINGMAWDDTNQVHLVADADDSKVYAYAADGTRSTDDEFDLDDLNGTPRSITWDDGFVLVVDGTDHKAYAYKNGSRVISDNIYLYYNSTKSLILFGNINIKNMGAVSRRLFDKVMTTDTGLEFLHNFDNTITDLNGDPYQYRADRILINETYLDFKLMSGVLSTEDGTFGYAVHKKDYSTAYLPPTESNGQVKIDSLAVIVITPRSTIEEVAANPTLIEAIGVSARQEIDANSTKLTEINSHIENNTDGITEVKSLVHENQQSVSDVTSQHLIIQYGQDPNDDDVHGYGSNFGKIISKETTLKIFDDDIEFEHVTSQHTDTVDTFALKSDYFTQANNFQGANRGVLSGLSITVKNLRNLAQSTKLNFDSATYSLISNTLIWNLPDSANWLSELSESTDELDPKGIIIIFEASTGDKLVDRVDDIKDDTEDIESKINTIRSATNKLNFNSNDDVIVTLDGETVTLTTSQINDIAAAVDAALLDAGDATDLLTAIRNKVAEIDWAASDIPISAIVTAVEASTVLAKQATLTARTKPTDDYFDPATDEVDIGKVKGTAVSGIDDFTESADIADMETDITEIKKHMVNTTEYDPVTSILSVKDDDDTTDIATYDITDENDNPTGTGNKAYKKLKREDNE